jgi:hypothetical protein
MFCMNLLSAYPPAVNIVRSPATSVVRTPPQVRCRNPFCRHFHLARGHSISEATTASLFRRPVRAGFYASRGPRRSLAALCAVVRGLSQRLCLRRYSSITTVRFGQCRSHQSGRIFKVRHVPSAGGAHHDADEVQSGAFDRRANSEQVLIATIDQRGHVLHRRHVIPARQSLW